MKLLVFSVFLVFAANASLVGKTAPSFTLKNQLGKEVKLEQFKGKFVVLEWLNYGCPFVKKHYNAGNMQKLQKNYTKKDVVWISIISSVEGKQGHSTPEKAIADMKENKSGATMVLLDTKGEVGKKYSAKTTPHMFVIGKDLNVLYEGAIDSISSTDQDDIVKAENYIEKALEASLIGNEVRTKKTKPYGCSVKY